MKWDFSLLFHWDHNNRLQHKELLNATFCSKSRNLTECPLECKSTWYSIIKNISVSIPLEIATKTLSLSNDEKKSPMKSLWQIFWIPVSFLTIVSIGGSVQICDTIPQICSNKFTDYSATIITLQLILVHFKIKQVYKCLMIIICNLIFEHLYINFTY